MSDKKINVLFGANTEGLQKGMKEAATVISDGGKQIAASSEKAASASVNAFKSLQQSYRATFKDAQILAQSQGLHSAAFLDAAKTAGAYKNQLDDTRAITAAFSSDTPALTAALGVGQGLAGAFAAAQGAMALFGADSKALQETMLKVQASIALVSGLQALGGLEDALTALSATIKTNVIPQLMAFNAAIMANPLIAITAAVIALGVAYATLSEDVSRVSQASREYVKVNLNISKSTDDLITKIEASNKTLQNQVDAKVNGISVEQQLANELKATNKELEKQKEAFKSNAKYQDELTTSGMLHNLNIGSKIKEYEQLINSNNRLIEGYEKQSKLEKKLAEKAKPKIDLKRNSGITLQGETDLSPLLPNVEIDKNTLANQIAAVMHEANMAAQQGAVTLQLSMNQVAEGLVASLDAVTAAAMNGGNVGEALTKSLLTSMGNFMSAWGAQLILVGLGAEALKASLKSLNGVAAIAAGAALVIAGGVAKSMASNMGSSGNYSGGSGSYSGNNQAAINYRPDQQNVSMVGIVRGQNIVIASSNTERNNMRVR